MTVTHIGADQRVVAVAVDSKVPSTNKTKHITIAIGPESKSQYSNELTNWKPISPITVKGIVQEVEKEMPVDAPSINPRSRPPTQPSPEDPADFVTKLMQGKPEWVIRNALQGRFPGITDNEINRLLALAK